MTASRYAAAKSSRVRHSSAVIRARDPAAGRDFRPFFSATSWLAIAVSLRKRFVALRANQASGAGHRVYLRGAFRQRTFAPRAATILAREDLAAAGRTVHASGVSLVEDDAEHRGLRLEAHVDALPRHAAVTTAEQDADLTLEACPRSDPNLPRIPGDLTDVAAIRLPFRIQRLESRAGPVLSRVSAREEAGAPDGEDGSGAPSRDDHPVHVDGVVVHVLSVAHVLPVLAAVEAADDAADLDGAVDLLGIGRIDGQLQDPLGGIGAASHRDFREADRHRQLLPALAAVVAAKDLAG